MKAIDKLIAAGDEPTIARLVFALRRGNTHAEYILLKNASVVMIPYLLEDVAHGSLEHYSDDSDTPPIGQVRVAATQIASAAIASIPDFLLKPPRGQMNSPFAPCFHIFICPQKVKYYWNGGTITEKQCSTAEQVTRFGCRRKECRIVGFLTLTWQPFHQNHHHRHQYLQSRPAGILLCPTASG
jgi:hypothetical protein